jgi:hypothetical protein
MNIERKTIITIDSDDELILFRGMALVASNSISKAIKNRHQILDIDIDSLRDIETMCNNLGSSLGD